MPRNTKCERKAALRKSKQYGESFYTRTCRYCGHVAN